MQQSLQIDFNSPAQPQSFASKAEARIEELRNEDQEEVLAFLEERPIHTAYLAGLISDNGIQSPLNRGTFFGFRNCFDQLEGVALIGHAILMETATDRALKAFAQQAQKCKTAHVIMCEENRIDKFWGYYAYAGQEMRRACREILYELRWPIEVSQQVAKLRQATLDDLDRLIPVHAQMALEESGVDPRTDDLEGFVERYSRRILQGRTWLLTENEKLVFKADVVSETPGTAYVEGVWVHPDARSQGIGRSCLSQLATMLLWKTNSICLFVNDENEEARQFYRQSGYHMRGVYDTIFLK